MASSTNNYNLNKPSPEDFYDIEVQNDNLEVIDQKLKELETGVDQVREGFEGHLGDYVRNAGFGVTGGTLTEYTLTLNPAPNSYADGQQFTILPHVDCGANPKLNVNGLGALTILKQDGSAVEAGDIKANKPLALVRVGSNFFIRSGGGSVIKSKQSGLATITSGNSYADINITPVNQSKAIVIYTVRYVTENNYGSGQEYWCNWVYVNNTTVRFTRAAASPYQVVVSWQLLEFYAKSVQYGITTLASTSQDIIINPINSSKSIVFINWAATGADTRNMAQYTKDYTLSNTALTVRGTYGGSGIVWAIVEFY